MIDEKDELENELTAKETSAENEASIDEVDAEETSEVYDEESEEEEELIEEDADEVAAELLKLKSEQISLENFDWSKYNNKWDVYTKDERSQLESMYDKTLSTIVENECVDGTVIAMNKREVVINIGYKSEGVVSLNEFRYNPNLKVGDKVEVYVESQEDKKGQLLLSHKKARAMRSWDRVNAALENDEVIQGYIKCRTKG
ncbi:MAG TPA: S1 RNA-binding domain-containing protein, partial [Bacteroidales bacterium]